MEGKIGIDTLCSHILLLGDAESALFHHQYLLQQDRLIDLVDQLEKRGMEGEPYVVGLLREVTNYYRPENDEQQTHDNLATLADSSFAGTVFAVMRLNFMGMTKRDNWDGKKPRKYFTKAIKLANKISRDPETDKNLLSRLRMHAFRGRAELSMSNPRKRLRDFDRAELYGRIMCELSEEVYEEDNGIDQEECDELLRERVTLYKDLETSKVYRFVENLQNKWEDIRITLGI